MGNFGITTCTALPLSPMDIISPTHAQTRLSAASQLTDCVQIGMAHAPSSVCLEVRTYMVFVGDPARPKLMKMTAALAKRPSAG